MLTPCAVDFSSFGTSLVCQGLEAGIRGSSEFKLPLFGVELEGFFYSVVSLFHVVSYDEVTEVVDSFCLKVVDCGTAENAECRLKL